MCGMRRQIWDSPDFARPSSPLLLERRSSSHGTHRVYSLCSPDAERVIDVSDDSMKERFKNQSVSLRAPRRRVSGAKAAARKKSLPMLVEDACMHGSLRKIVAGLSVDPVLQQDMLQECLVCLWLVESEKPGRTRSWYLQNCRFHVQHWLASGRSVDSPKRARADKRISIDSGGDDAALEGYDTNGELFEAVSFHDIVATLSTRLTPNERAILQGLADGFVLRDIAYKSGLSYPTALKYRRKIAALTIKLGIAGPDSGGKLCV